jgi:hypothetical protein
MAGKIEGEKTNMPIEKPQWEKPLQPPKETVSKDKIETLEEPVWPDWDREDPRLLNIIHIINRLLLEMAKKAGEMTNLKYELLGQFGSAVEACLKIQQGIHTYSRGDWPGMPPEEQDKLAQDLNRTNGAFTEKVRQMKDRHQEFASRIRTSAESSSKTVDDFYKFIGDTLTTLSTVVMRLK